jgi:type I restriction enzyme S subunit
MGGEWRETTLDQLGRIITGKTPPSTRPEYFGGDIPFVTPTDFDGRRLIDTTGRYLTEEGAKSINSSRIPAGAVMVSCIGSDMGKAAVAGRPSITNQQINSIVVDSGDDPLFVYYNLSVRKAEIRSAASGSAQPILNKAAFGRLDILLPPQDEQCAIAHILGTLDDKIELNRRMNETLEALVRALFQSWFVDFDPVRAKAKGRDPGLPKPLAALFPCRFQDSALGQIPECWRVYRWRELVALEYGKSLSGYENDEAPYPVYGTNGRIGSHSELLCTHSSIIIGRKGAYRGVHFCNSPFFVIDTAFYIEPKEPIELRWAYYELLRQDINSMDSGSAIPSTSREDFYSLPVLTPPFNIQRCFVELLTPFWNRQEQNEKESRTLAAIRDTLLPKLISGELRVKNAERFLAEARV